ncbi:transmembrane protein 184C [Angomonas deanei]|nr:transmembrane protein 184C [Angomonas deanei]|eukprot:EPY35375.1 transmembrane protein 184C [Angomonas deanei]
MRIILMIPVYAFFSAISLLFPKGRFFYIIIRDTYEAFVLYIFFMLMIAYCGGEGQLLRSLKRKRYRGVHPWPLCCIPSYPLDRAFYLRCKRWVLQCALIKPITSFIALVTDPFGIYQEGTFAVNNVYTYNCIIINFSLTWALYYLVLFEIECGKEMHYARTFLKFLCVKSIIFFSYWQSVLVSLLAMSGILYMGKNDHESETTSAVIQDLLMCFELLPVAFLHRAAFGRDKLDEEMACVPVYMKDNNTGNFRANIDTALSVNDIVDDTIGTIFYRKGKLLDMENAESDHEEDDAVATNDKTDSNFVVGDVEMMARDPTLDDLVRHAIMTDYGVRVDGALHYDEDSDREERNQEMHFADTDVILHRSKKQALDDVRVDTELMRSHQTQTLGTPAIYCVVCGRFDREMVRRHNGYKCKECVGTKSQKVLRRRQRNG